MLRQEYPLDAHGALPPAFRVTASGAKDYRRGTSKLDKLENCIGTVPKPPKLNPSAQAGKADGECSFQGLHELELFSVQHECDLDAHRTLKAYPDVTPMSEIAMSSGFSRMGEFPAAQMGAYGVSPSETLSGKARA